MAIQRASKAGPVRRGRACAGCLARTAVSLGVQSRTCCPPRRAHENAEREIAGSRQARHRLPTARPSRGQISSSAELGKRNFWQDCGGGCKPTIGRQGAPAQASEHDSRFRTGRYPILQAKPCAAQQYRRWCEIAAGHAFSASGITHPRRHTPALPRRRRRGGRDRGTPTVAINGVELWGGDPPLVGPA